MNEWILLVEDNESILYGNKRMLKRRGYSVLTALTLAEARERLAARTPDAIILDIMLPDGSGLDFTRKLRQISHIPILFLTGLGTPEDVVRGLTEGGDDYLTKPYDFPVLLARIEALLRRTQQCPEVLNKGLLKLNLTSGLAFCGDEDLLLTQKDFRLLLLFTQNESKPMSGEYLYERVWHAPLNEDSQAIKSAVSRLRKKLTGSGYTLSATRGKGYVFQKSSKE